MDDQYIIRTITRDAGVFLHATDVSRVLRDVSLDPSLTQLQAQVLRGVAEMIIEMAKGE